MDAPDLAPFVGTWVGTWRTWVVPDVLHDESPITAEIRPLLAGGGLLLSSEAAHGGGGGGRCGRGRHHVRRRGDGVDLDDPPLGGGGTPGDASLERRTGYRQVPRS